jgi:hypothetical protein
MFSQVVKDDFTPDEVRSLGAAFDEAERQLDKMRPVTIEIDASRLRTELAKAVVRLAKAGETEPFFLSRVAVGHALVSTRLRRADACTC